VRFVKFQAFGNDYIVLNANEMRDVSCLNDFATSICALHYGAGADGIAVVEISADDEADYDVRIFNPDGSEAGLSGNGTRCAAAFLYREKVWTEDALRLRTCARTTLYRLIENDLKGNFLFDSELGRPTFNAASIPVKIEFAQEPIVDFPLSLASGEELRATMLSVGNPHCAFFVEDFAALDWHQVGAAIERHPIFPERTNVEFIRMINSSSIELRIWERGVGETRSSGTCASAAAIASAINNRCGRKVNVITPGGKLHIEWREADDVIVLRGRADVVYEGIWLGSVNAGLKSYGEVNSIGD
jgi:diaminopimelate epimerase